MFPFLNLLPQTNRCLRSWDSSAPTYDLGYAARNDDPGETKAFVTPLLTNLSLCISPLHGSRKIGQADSRKVAQAAALARPWEPVQGPDLGNFHHATVEKC